ncbi:MbtH family protein [Acerihabitans arboris]|uniref:MbtH family NRPS accessory protein n=1 Tax=Acerihabitans arboris TaxID=2691583 RepID=A0A845SKC0_9GAMM|nr:MbtH family NRPS accessory protein [Acerihabitans arboris]NDL63832.1 MbtH family NRPS accessory protein [Acerihabitans arboris]
MEQLNPFDDPLQDCLVLRNQQSQYSLWPDFSPVPRGWAPVFGPAPRAECGRWLETHWTDMRPAALRGA